VPRRACLRFVLLRTILLLLFTFTNHVTPSAPHCKILMSFRLLNQLWHAVAGDGAEQANDVGSLFFDSDPAPV
jgi:hypothetical protein